MNKIKALPRHFQSPLLHDGLAVALLLLIILLFLGRGLIPGKILLPLDIVIKVWPPWQQPDQPAQVQNLLLGDPVNYIFPVKEFAADSVRQGVFPLWNPYSLGGYPFTYNTQAGLLYPLSMAYYLLPAATAVNVVIALQMFLGAFFMYLYLRLIVARRLAALAGAVLFSLNGLMVVWLEWQVVYAAVIWLPLQLFLVERMVRRALATDNESMVPSSYNIARMEALLAGIALAVSWLGGHWNWTLYASMTLGMYLLWRLWRPFRHAQTTRLRRQIMFLFALPLLIGLALSLVQVLPAFNYLRQSHRETLTFAGSLDQGLLNRLVVLFIPNFFGSPQHQNWWGPPPTNYVETTFYMGILPLLLGGLAPFLRRDNTTLFFMTWGSLGFLWALGTPVYGLLYVLPMFGGLLPSRAAILVVFCLSVLAAIALDRLADVQLSYRPHLLRITGGMLALLLAVALAYFFTYRADVARTWSYLQPYTGLFLLSLVLSGSLLLGRLNGWLSPTLFGWLALVWLTADLFAFGFGYNPVASIDNLYPPTSTAAFFHSDPSIFRMTTLAEGVVFPPNTSLVPRLTNVSGYEPGILRRFVNFINTAEGESAIRNERELIPLKGINSPLMALLNLKYIVTISDWWEADPVRGVTQELIAGWLPLIPGVVKGQSFTMPDAGLHRLDLWLQSTGDPSGMVTVRIFTTEGGQELAHSNLDITAVREAGRYNFFFEAFPSEWGRAFYFTVEFEGTGMVTIGLNNLTTEEMAFDTYYLPRPNLVHEDGKTRIYLNEGYFPRSFAVPQAIVVKNEEEALATMLAHAGELNSVVILELEGQPPPDLNTLLTPQSFALSPVTITHYGLNRVELAAEMAAPGFVVLSDTYYPGWQARIDGRNTPVYRANSILRAVYIPAGRHKIEFVFRPPDFIIGAVISGLTLLGCCLFLFKWGWQKIRR